MEDALILDESYVQPPVTSSKTTTTRTSATAAATTTGKHDAQINDIRQTRDNDDRGVGEGNLDRRRRGVTLNRGDSGEGGGGGGRGGEGRDRGEGGGSSYGGAIGAGGGRDRGVSGEGREVGDRGGSRGGVGGGGSGSDGKKKTREEAPLPLPDAFGPAMRETKIRNLKQKCKEVLGDDEEKFVLVYQFLQKARGGGGGGESGGGEAAYIGETHIFDGIRKLGVNPADCFLVEQLLFLEEMATGSR